MKLVVAKVSRNKTYGLINDNFFLPVKETTKKTYPTLKDLLNFTGGKPPKNEFENQSKGIPICQITYLPPISESNKIICVGINYPKFYDREFKEKPSNIILFSRFNETVVGHKNPIRLPSGLAGQSFDYEGEIALVIGSPGFKISQENASKHILGYTLFNDGSVRSWQKESLFAGKNFFQSGSCGPYIVTKEEINNFQDMVLETKINGIVVQKSSSSKMFFNTSEIVSYISHIIPLDYGDIIATGSPEGTGANKSPPKFLKKGDTIEVSSSKIGNLQNVVI